MSYIQIDIGGKLRGWKANQMTIETFSRLLSVEDITSSSSYAAVYAGLVANCYVKREEPDFTFENVCDWVDGIYQSKNTEVLEKVKEAFESSTAYTALIEKLETNTDKPKKKVKRK